MSKKIISLLTAVIIASSILCSCGSDKQSTEAQDTTTTTIATTTEETSLRLPPKVTVSEFSLKKENTQSETTSTTKLKTTKKTESTTITTTTKAKSSEKQTTTTAKPTERPVPAIVKSILVETSNSNGFDKNFMYYCKEYGFSGESEDVMWFQDIDGDRKPDLVLGGHTAVTPKTGQGRSNCYCLYLSSGQGSDYLEFKPDYAHRNKYGHNAFVLQAYTDKNGELMFTQTQFHAYTSSENSNPKYAGTFGMYEYDFKNGKSEKDKKLLLFYGYEPKSSSGQGYFSCHDGNDNSLTAAQAKKFYKNYYSDKTPLKANVKTIKYSDYLKMTKKQRQKALTESYYAFSYTVDKSIKPYAKEVFDNI